MQNIFDIASISVLVERHGTEHEKKVWQTLSKVLAQQTDNTAMLEIAVLLREIFGIVESGGDHNLSGREIENRLDAVVLQLQQ